MKMISIIGSLKAYYYLLAIDGQIDDKEMQCFKEICMETDDTADEYLGELLAECDEVLKKAEGNEYEEIVQEAFDKVILNETTKDLKSIPTKLLLWNMLVLAYANNEYSSSEQKVIGHASRILSVDKSVFMEMEQMARTAATVSKELSDFEQSDRPYRIIRPIVDELEKRLEVISHAAKCLIRDETEVDDSYESKEKQNKIADAMINAGSAISDTAVNAGNRIGGLLKGIKNKNNDKEMK